ncbi:unnamed protein product [Rotaria sordida]|uniref:Uncharacterized protein n=1 Tax=Rotaria sordida TaxID=392033 RepID=A0A814S739_9BILA|nr:unnamed protein product [Rotaria sordida]CAF1257128.1 unnamed protein product [Rotaria sordida]CAF1310762.1 unnamed protein product [Rotaria sordida]CAF1375735.1 unnamed protein product [Rotaria sordida]
MYDRLRLIRFPMPIVDAVRQAILTGWPRGIQLEQQRLGAHEFKLYGRPWLGQSVEAIPARILIMTVLSALYHHGWYLLTAADVSKKEQDKDSLFFRLGSPPSLTPFFAVSFNESDKLRLIGAPENLIEPVQQTIGRANIQREEWRDNGAAYQLKLRGNPWWGSGDEAITTRVTLLALLDCFNSFGWELYASIDISGESGSDTDSWFFRQKTQ